MATPLSRSEIGAHMFVSLNTVKTRMFYARARLAGLLKAAGVTES